MSGPGNLQTSGNPIYNQVATQIITSAFRKMGTINDTEVPSANQMADAMTALNAMVKFWVTSGIHIWLEEEALLFLQQGQVMYQLGGTAPNSHCANIDDVYLGQMNANGIAGASTLNIASIPGLQPDQAVTKGQNFGVLLDTGQVYWTTAATAPDSGGNINIAGQLPSSASVGNTVFAYTTEIWRPLRVPAVRRLQYIGLLETPLTKMMSRQEYMDLPNKYNPGLVNQAFYNPSRTQGQMYVWQQPIDGTFGLRFTYYRTIENFDGPDDLPDFPEEWILVLQWCLAKELGPEYSVPPERWDRILAQSENYMEQAKGWDREFQSVFFGLSYDQTLR